MTQSKGSGRTVMASRGDDAAASAEHTGAAQDAGTRLGAWPRSDGTTMFRVWAPHAKQVEVLLDGDRLAPLERGADGHHTAVLDQVPPGTTYQYVLDGDKDQPLPDPASRHQPEGVFGPSEVVAPFDAWHDDGWRGVPLDEVVLYELHVGTFTDEGTFDAIIPHLDHLVDLGITVVELMPVAQFSGGRNWGYDGVLPFATQDTYGGPHGLARLVDACHARGLGVAMDVVYNHIGPEGNVLPRFGPYFTDRYATPWGPAVNFDDRDSDPVRRFFIENALYWIDDLHIDMLRLDAVHAIRDATADPFLHQLTRAVHRRAEQRRRIVQVVAESAANEPRLLRPAELGGFGMDAQWNDDAHHALHAVLTGETHGYYADFGDLESLATSIRQGFVFTGQYSHYRGRRHGAPPTGIDLRRFVTYAQNHDQTGNRAMGERLGALASDAALRLGAAWVCLSPSLPMLFMGEEHAEERPFQYFTSHQDPELAEAVRKGRREEGRRFGWQGDTPDPQAASTFERSRIDHARRATPAGRAMWHFHRHLLHLRRTVPALGTGSETLAAVDLHPDHRTLVVHRRAPPDVPSGDPVVIAYHFGDRPVERHLELPPGTWRRLVASEDPQWGGSGEVPPTDLVPQDGQVTLHMTPQSMVAYRRDQP